MWYSICTGEQEGERLMLPNSILYRGAVWSVDLGHSSPIAHNSQMSGDQAAVFHYYRLTLDKRITSEESSQADCCYRVPRKKKRLKWFTDPIALYLIHKENHHGVQFLSCPLRQSNIMLDNNRDPARIKSIPLYKKEHSNIWYSIRVKRQNSFVDFIVCFLQIGQFVNGLFSKRGSDQHEHYICFSNKNKCG